MACISSSDRRARNIWASAFRVVAISIRTVSGFCPFFPARVCGFCGFAENSRQPFVSGGSLAFCVCGFLRRVAEKIPGPQLSAVFRKPSASSPARGCGLSAVSAESARGGVWAFCRCLIAPIRSNIVRALPQLPGAGFVVGASDGNKGVTIVHQKAQQLPCFGGFSVGGR